MKIRAFLFVILAGLACNVQASAHAEDEIDLQYAIDSLHRHIDTLEAFNTRNKALKLIVFKKVSQDEAFIDTVIDFGHDLMRICVKKMLHEESLDPLFSVWQLFIAEYRDIDPHIFVKEMSILIFAIYKNILLTFYGNQNEQNPAPELLDDATIQEIVKLYSQVSALPLKQIFMGLDKCYNQFMRIMNSYGISDSTLSWSEWIQKYWWLPPVVITSTVVTALQYALTGSSSISSLGGGATS